MCQPMVPKQALANDSLVDEVYRLQAEKHQARKAKMYARITNNPKPADPGAACQGCGSRETIVHNGERQCAYCRGDR